jgi:LuxR family maltose regulon positive regulatory protein
VPAREPGVHNGAATRSRPRPPLTRHHVPRPRIDLELDDAAQAMLALVCAPAGAGKTEALAGWLSRREVPAGWLALSGEDNDPAVFWPSLAAALNASGADRVRSADQLVAQLGREPASPRTAVLDDYHVVVEPQISAGLDVLLAANLPSIHLLIGSRHDPVLKLSRLRAAGQLREIRFDQLRFDEAEAASLLNDRMGLAVGDADIADLALRTEGWAVGLQLAALALQRRADRHAYIAQFSADDRHVADYVRDEVVGTLPTDLRRFVEETAILDRLSAPLCEAVCGTEDAQPVLEELERRNLFLVPLDHRRQWYRYHHLFAEWLRLRALPGSDERHRRAASWLAEHGFTGDAVGHHVKTGDFVAAADLIESQRWSLISRGRQHTLHHWIRVLPADLRRDRPHLTLAEAWIAYHEGRWSDVQTLAEAVSSRSDLATHADGDAFRAEALCLTAGSLVAGGDLTAANTLALEALTLVGPDWPVGSALWLIVGKCRLGGGDLASAATAFETARRLQPMVPIVELIALSHRAEIHRRQGDLGAAERDARSALSAAHEAALEEHPECAVAHLVLARVLDDSGREEEAQVHLARGTELAGRLRYEPRRRLAAEARRQAGVAAPSRSRSGARVELSERERDVLRLLASPMTQAEIASHLYVSVNTLKTHTRSIYQKLGVNSRHAALEVARNHHLM